MKETNLLPCPFCGGEAEVIKAHSVFKRPYVVICKNKSCHASVGEFSKNRKEAIKAWNTRKPMERIMERLKEEPYINKGGELFLNGYNEDCLPLRKVFEIVKEEGGIE